MNEKAIEIIARQKQEILRLGGMLSDATEAAARYQDALRQAENRLRRVREALTK
jgi:hypothetical protein